MIHDTTENIVITFDVYGRRLVVEKSAGAWRVYHCGAEGKRRPAEDIRIPPQLTPEEIGAYLADVCHEWANERRPAVKRLR